MSFIHIAERSLGWFVIGRGHQYEPQGEVYLWPDGIWSTLDSGAQCETQDEAESRLKQYRYKVGVQDH
jgi:hypothetical protein